MIAHVMIVHPASILMIPLIKWKDGGKNFLIQKQVIHTKYRIRLNKYLQLRKNYNERFHPSKKVLGICFSYQEAIIVYLHLLSQNFSYIIAMTKITSEEASGEFRHFVTSKILQQAIIVFHII
ncbi:hypothetical protein ACJX0J_037603 [Zea mays]